MEGKKTWTKWIYWFLLGVALIFVYKTIDSFDNIATSLGGFLTVMRPIFLAILLAYLFYIPCRAFERLYQKIKMNNKMARLLSVITVYIIALLLIAILLNIILPAISKSAMDLANNWPRYYEQATSYVNNMPEDSIIQKESVKGLINNLQEINITQFFSMDHITDYINRAMGIVNTVFGMFITLILSIYILLDRTKILEFMTKVSKALFKEKANNSVMKYFNEGNEIFFKYISSQVIDAIIIGIISAIILWIMGVQYGILLAIIIAILNVVPILGAILSTIIVAIAALLTGGTAQALWVLIIFTILQQIDANILKPKLIDSILKVSPVLTLITVTIAGAYYGMLRNVYSSTNYSSCKNNGR